MDFAKGLIPGVEISGNISLSGGIDPSKVTGGLASATAATSQIIQKTVVVKEKVVEDSSAFKVQIEKLTKENTSLRSQIEKMTKIMASQTKELTAFKQSKAGELQQMSTTIQTTTQVSAADQSKMAELQAQMQKFVEENKRDDAQIASMKLTIDQQNIRIHSLETLNAENAEASLKKVNKVKEKLAAAMEKLKAFSGDDVADKQKVIDLEVQVKKLKDHLEIQTKNAEENATTAEKWKADYLKEADVSAELRKQVEDLTREKGNLTTERDELNTNIETLKKAASEADDELNKERAEVTRINKCFKDAKAEADSAKEKVKKLKTEVEGSSGKVRDAEEKARKADVKCRDLEAQLQEKSRGFEVLKAKVQTLDPLNQKLQDKIIQLENELKNVKDRLNFELEQDVKEQEQINDLTNKLSDKIKAIEKMEMGDAEGRSKVEFLTTQITTLTTQITTWRTKAEETKKALDDKENLLVLKNQTIDRLRKLIAGLKNELEMAQDLSMKFEINKTQTEICSESVSQSIMVSAEYKKLELAAEELKKQSLQCEQRAAQFRDENEKLTAKLAEQNGAMDKLMNQLNALKVDFEAEKNEKMALKAEKEQLTVNASQSHEKATSFFKSAEESVTTYRDEIGKAYSSIAMTFSEIEHEIL